MYCYLRSPGLHSWSLRNCWKTSSWRYLVGRCVSSMIGNQVPSGRESQLPRVATLEGRPTDQLVDAAGKLSCRCQLYPLGRILPHLSWWLIVSWSHGNSYFLLAQQYLIYLRSVGPCSCSPGNSSSLRLIRCCSSDRLNSLSTFPLVRFLNFWSNNRPQYQRIRARRFSLGAPIFPV